jgi:hypothetical protein
LTRIGNRSATLRIYQLPTRDFSALLARLALRSILRVRDQSIFSPRKLTNQTNQTKQQLTDFNV